jgi:hypothetical protein
MYTFVRSFESFQEFKPALIFGDRFNKFSIILQNGAFDIIDQLLVEIGSKNEKSLFKADFFV